MSQHTQKSSIGSGRAVDATPYSPFPRNTMKKPRLREPHDEARTTSARDAIRLKKPKQRPKGKPRSPVKYHVWNGRIVAVELEPGSESTLTPDAPPRASAASSPSRPTVLAEETVQDLRTPSPRRHRKGRENEAIKTPLLPPVRPPSKRSPRIVKSSPTKEDVWNKIHQASRKWPDLPAAFSHCDIQVCLSHVVRVRGLTRLCLV